MKGLLIGIAVSVVYFWLPLASSILLIIHHRPGLAGALWIMVIASFLLFLAGSRQYR